MVYSVSDGAAAIASAAATHESTWLPNGTFTHSWSQSGFLPSVSPSTRASQQTAEITCTMSWDTCDAITIAVPTVCAMIAVLLVTVVSWRVNCKKEGGGE